LLERPALIALNKIDLLPTRERQAAARALEASLGRRVLPISAAEGLGLEPLIAQIALKLSELERVTGECPN
jgi:Fe2+ transport system protein B